MKKLLFLTLLLISSLIEASTKSFDFYTDGVYDAYTEIENSLRRGLKEDKIKDLENRWLVIQDITKDSTVQLIFYRTVAHKNNFFEAVIARDEKTRKNYMVYGSFTRRADAEYASTKLLDKGLNVKVVYAGKNSNFTTNPIVVKKLIADMKKLLEDTPVLVIKRTEILTDEKKCSDKNVIVKKVVQKCDKKKELKSIVLKQFYKLREQWKFRGTVDLAKKEVVFRERSGIKNHFKIKDFFKGFKISEIYYASSTQNSVVKLLGFDGRTYKLYKKKCEPLKKEQKSKQKKAKIEQKKHIAKKTIEKPSKPKPSKLNVAAEKQDDVYMCDFSLIKIAYTKKGDKVRVKDTHYSGKIIDVKVKKDGDRYELRHSGFETLLIRPFYFKYCNKVK